MTFGMIDHYPEGFDQNHVTITRDYMGEGIKMMIRSPLIANHRVKNVTFSGDCCEITFFDEQSDSIEEFGIDYESPLLVANKIEEEGSIL